FGDLFHGEFYFTRLQVGNENFSIPLQLSKLLRKHARAQMLGGDGQVLFTVAERRFNDQVPKVRQPVDNAPERIIRSGIAREHKAGASGVQHIAYGRHDMVRRQGRYTTAGKVNRVAYLE